MIETTSLGAAYAAGLAVGYWNDLYDLTQNGLHCTPNGKRPWKGPLVGWSSGRKWLVSLGGVFLVKNRGWQIFFHNQNGRMEVLGWKENGISFTFSFPAPYSVLKLFTGLVIAALTVW
jgi:hypothetical protein